MGLSGIKGFMAFLAGSQLGTPAPKKAGDHMERLF